MTTQRLISELTNFPSISDEVKVLYDRCAALSGINTAQDLDSLIELNIAANTCKISQGLPRINISIMAVHATVLKPFTNSSTDEDDFI